MDWKAALIDIVGDAEPLRSRWSEVEAEWSPEPPPATVLASELADATVSVGLSDDELARVARAVDRSLSGGSENTKEVVMTGFLETLAARSADGESVALQLEASLSETAQRYCRRWRGG